MEVLVGSSEAMQCVRDAIEQLAAQRRNFTLVGETGTGKSRLARYVAASRGWEGAPFVTIDGAAPGEPCFSAGILKALESARGGTLLIDHIGEMPFSVQASLVDWVQSRGDTGVPRIIAAAHVPLDHAVSAGLFHGGLCALVYEAVLSLPPLRHRLEDIPALAHHFFDKRQTLRYRQRLSPAALGRLARHTWPGNIRELNNVLRRAMILGGPRAVLRSCDIVFDAHSFTTRRFNTTSRGLGHHTCVSPKS